MAVSILLVRTLVEAVAHLGANRLRLLDAAGIDPSTLEDPDSRIELSQYDALLTAALDATGDEALGLHIGEHTSPATLGVVGPLLSSAPTMRSGVEVLTRFQSILHGGPPSTLVESADRATLRFEFSRSQPPCDRLRAEFGLAVLLGAGRAYVGKDKAPYRVCFEHPRPSYASEYARVFQCEVVFDAAFTGIEFDRAWLDTRHLHENPALFSTLESEAETRLRQLDAGAPISARVCAALSQYPPHERPGMDEVARRVGMSTRSLRRHLSGAGVSFHTLVRGVFGDQACKLLDDATRTVQEVAHAMGYSDASAFHRAFKRSTGLTPRQYRDRAREPDSGELP